MAITSTDELLNALGNNSSRIVIDKASLANAVSGRMYSLWQAAGVPSAGGTPTSTPAICTKDTVGAMGFDNQTAPVTSYLAWLALVGSLSPLNLEIHDRLVHRGGLVGNVITSQTATTNLSGISSERIGAANYSDVQWWLEWYTATGGTAANTTAVNVTYDDDSTGNITVPIIATSRAANMAPIIPAVAGRFIKQVNSVQLNISTGTAGNFGVTATRPRTSLVLSLLSRTEVFDAIRLGVPNIPNDACLFFLTMCTTTTTGTIRGQGKIAHG